ncbi:MAG: TIGR00730 family Rossman fold protein [Pseudomonadota bacterium]
MRLCFHEPNPEIDDMIQALMDKADVNLNRDIIREIIIAGLKTDQDTKDRCTLKMMNMTLKEMRYTAKVFDPYGDRLKISVFGSARTGQDTSLYNMARSFAGKMIDRGFMVITGGGPGIMEAANKGAGPDNSFGVTIKLPFEQLTNEIIANNPRTIHYKYFFNRKIAFIKETHAVALFPGGFGTLDEATEAITLVQTGKQNPMPIVLLETKNYGYWEKWLDFVERQLLAEGYISAEDVSLLSIYNDETLAADAIASFYRNYHSMRCVGNLVVIRLKNLPGEYEMARLNEEFSDCLAPGGLFELRGALPEEQDEPILCNMPRLTFPFNKQSYARLRALIDCINSFKTGCMHLKRIAV